MSFPLLGLLGHDRPRPVFVVGQDVFAAPLARVSGRRIPRQTTLAAEAKVLGDRICWGDERSVPDAIRACECLEHLWELQFCCRQLLPLLRCVATEDQTQAACPDELGALLTDLEEQAGHVQELVPRTPLLPIAPDTLAEMLGAPCQLTATQVIPLELADTVPSARETIVLNALRFVPRPEKARPVSEVVRSIEQEVRSRLRAGPAERRMDGRVARFLATAEAIIEFHNPVRRGHYRVIYHDRCHQLQYLRSQFVLVRGPIGLQSDGPSCFVGVRVRGSTRRSILSARPHWASTDREFWTPHHTPKEGGVCMGKEEQYQRLRSALFTDAEALTLWLDAAVGLVSGRTREHSPFRGPYEPRLREAVRALRRYIDERYSGDATRSLF